MGSTRANDYLTRLLRRYALASQCRSTAVDYCHCSRKTHHPHAIVLRRLLRCVMSFADFSATIVLGSTFETFNFRRIGILSSLLSLIH